MIFDSMEGLMTFAPEVLRRWPYCLVTGFEGKQASCWSGAYPRRGVEIIIASNYSKCDSDDAVVSDSNDIFCLLS